MQRACMFSPRWAGWSKASASLRRVCAWIRRHNHHDRPHHASVSATSLVTSKAENASTRWLGKYSFFTCTSCLEICIHVCIYIYVCMYVSVRTYSVLYMYIYILKNMMKQRVHSSASTWCLLSIPRGCHEADSATAPTGPPSCPGRLFKPP